MQFFVASTGGDYIYGVPSREPGVAATAGVLDSYRMVLGSRDPNPITNPNPNPSLTRTQPSP